MGRLASTYQHIANILSFDFSDSDLEKSLSHSSFNWDALVIVGSRQVLLPAIYCRLKAKNLLHVLPKDLETYLHDITSINRNRNKSILKQVHSIALLLHQHHIDHTFIKGAALLALGCYKDNAERMVGDIDILVAKHQLKVAFDLIKGNGYDKTFGFAYETQGHRHLDRLISTNELAAIELHSDLLVLNQRDKIDITAVLNSKRTVNNIAVPSTFYLSKHQILAWQLNDSGHIYHAVNFKILYDNLVLNLPSDTELLLDLSQSKFGQSYLAIAQFYFKEFQHISAGSKSKLYKNLHLKYIDHLFYSVVLKRCKQACIWGVTRLKLVFNNTSYRRHVLKKIFISKK
jgi:hypothetical protein